jgi:hypothetical protein
MTEAEWLTCTDPTRLLEFLRGKVSDRKLRLFACACCRRVNHLLTPELAQALEVAERFADGRADARARKAARAAAMQTPRSGSPVPPSAYLGDAKQRVVEALRKRAMEAARYTLPFGEETFRTETLRCLFGNPYRPVQIQPAWLRWKDGTIPRLTLAIYDGRDFASLPVLADALEEAGCTDADILGHCRGPEPHARGCWVVDALLGRT